MRRKLLTVLVIVTICTSYLYARLYVIDGSKTLEIYFLDVGQGDSILFKTPDGYWGLVDSGKSGFLLSQLQQVLPYGQRQLEFVIGSHPDADHVEGFIELLDYFHVEKSYWVDHPKTNEMLKWLKHRLSEEKVEGYSLNSDNDFTFGCCVQIDVLWPAPQAELAELDANDASVAILLSYGEFELYLGGDLSTEYELKSLGEVANSSSIDVLKAGHHGSRTSSGLPFLSKVKPRLTIISAGENNSYGHPHQEVLDSLTKIRTVVLRTDQHGRIKISTDGERMWVTAQKLLEEFEVSI